MMYMVTSSSLLCLIFGGLVVWTIHLASRELPLNALSPSDDGTEPFSLPSPIVDQSNGDGPNGDANEHELPEHTNGESNGGLSSLSGSLGEADAAHSAEVQPAEVQAADATVNG
jgi:hypothetical protein